jgi:hypothetical protein
MLFPVARQREAPMKPLSRNNVAGYLAMTPSQQYGERLFSVRSVPRLYHPQYNYNAGVFVELVCKQLVWNESFAVVGRHG